MRFQVPQFINVEDKIFGPLTVKQFVYLAGGAGLCFTIYHFLNFFAAILIIIPIAALSLALAFFQVSGKPFVFILEAAIMYAFGNKLYIWRKNEKKPVSNSPASAEPDSSFVPRLSDSKLKEITWSLDIKKNLEQEGGK